MTQKNIDNARRKYKKFNLVSFPFKLVSTYNKNKNKFVKNNSILPSDWSATKINSKFLNKPSNYNGIAILTGKLSNIFVIDIDIVDDWLDWLEKTDNTNNWLNIQDNVITANSANGGKHLYFRYSDELDNIKGKANCFGREWAIDSRSNGNCIYCPPSKLKNNDVDWEYTWEQDKSFDDLELINVPEWLYEQLNKKVSNNIKDKYIEKSSLTDEMKNIIDYLKLLSPHKCEIYDEWLAVGINLYCISSDDQYLHIWDTWSKRSNRYENGACYDKWKTFAKYTNNPDKSIAMLKSWARQDNPDIYNEKFGNIEISVEHANIIKPFITERFHYPPTRISGIVIKNYDNKNYIFININEKYCPISKIIHDSDSNYIQISFDKATIKCHNKDCDNKNGKLIHFRDFNIEMREVVKNILLEKQNDMEIIEKHFQESLEIEEINNMNTKLSEKKDTILGYKYDMNGNLYCPIHKKFHDKAENCLYISEQKRKMAVMCNLAPLDSIFPSQGIDVPTNIIQIVTGNTINNIQNNYYNSNDELYDSLFDETFDIFEDKELNKLMNISFKGYASDIAEVFYYLGYNIFGVQMEEKDIWWAWDLKEKKWIKSSHKAHIFCNKIVAEKYIFVNKWFRENTQSNDTRLKRLSKIDAILKRLKDKDQSTILTQAAILFKDNVRNFENKIDANKDIINFNGLIFNFDTLDYKESIPEDMVSRSTGYTIPEPDLNQQKIIMEFIDELMPDKSQVNYLLTWIASCLDGWNRDENFHILTGCGRNGKSLLRDLIANAFGGSEDGNSGYYITISSTLLTHERPSSEKPIPDLMTLKGARIVIGSEPEKKKSINEGFLKFITGNDPINGRLLYSNSNVTFLPQHSLALLCNKIPKLDSDDEAAWDRSKIIEFPFKFVTKPSQMYHKKIDKNMKNKLPKLGPQFMLILLDYYKKYKNEGLEPTPEIINITEEVRDQCDYYNEYVKECLELVNDKKMRLKRSDINQQFLIWIQHHPIYKSKINDVDINYLKKAIESKFGEMNNNLYLPDGKGTNKGWMFIKYYKKKIEPDFLED